MTRNASKFVQSVLREFSGIAYERELAGAARALQAEFARWNSGEIDVFELNRKIHEFHQGISRDLYGRYVMADVGIAVAGALHRGILTRAEIGQPAYSSVEGIVRSFASLDDRSGKPDARPPVPGDEAR